MLDASTALHPLPRAPRAGVWDELPAISSPCHEEAGWWNVSSNTLMSAAWIIRSSALIDPCTEHILFVVLRPSVAPVRAISGGPVLYVSTFELQLMPEQSPWRCKKKPACGLQEVTLSRSLGPARELRSAVALVAVERECGKLTLIRKADTHRLFSLYLILAGLRAAKTVVPFCRFQGPAMALHLLFANPELLWSC